MNEVIEQLRSRNSAPRLVSPGPGPDALEQMFAAALRAPDHAWLQPWRFLVIEHEARAKLGEVFVRALLQEQPGADEVACAKARGAPLRAPTLVVVTCKVREHPKVPRDEQLISAGCAAHAMLLAAEALGFAGVWRTGAYATDSTVHEALALSASEEIVAFLYFGTRDGPAKPLPERKVENYVNYWTS
jgi:nitroreductase